MKTSLLKLAAVALLFTACEGEENDPQTTLDSGEFKSATITLLNDSETPDFRWTYVADGQKLSSVKWEQYDGLNFNENVEVGALVYDGNKINGTDYTFQGSVTTYTVSYNAEGQMQKVSYSNDGSPTRIWNFEFEYENGRVAQVNKYRENNGTIDVSTTFELTYDANENVSEIRSTQGALVTTITLEYNSDINAFRNNNASQFIFAADFSYRLSHVWGHQLAVAFSKHSLTELNSSNSNGSFAKTLSYTKDAEDRISRVTESTTYSTGGTIINYWDVTY